MSVVLELEDIQGVVLLNRPLPYFGSYLFFSIDDAEEARAGLARLIPHVTSAVDWHHPTNEAWINVVFTVEGLRRLGIDEETLAHFPIPFREGMAARNVFLGDTGESDPSLWNMPHAFTGFHMGILLMGRSAEERETKVSIGIEALKSFPQVHLISRLDVEVPENFREHFGFADGLSRPFIEGQGGAPKPGHEDPAKAGEFVLGYENEFGQVAKAGGPEEFWRNGTYLSIRKLGQRVAAFRKYLRDSADTPEGQELTAAKMMGRWRSGAPLAISPDKDDAALAQDDSRRNAFKYLDDDPDGRKTPLGSHIRRVNPRDAMDHTITKTREHRLLRRGAAYGPLLPEDALEDDGVDRGIVISIVNADPARQFEFVQSQWINDGNFIAEGSRTDPIVGRHDKTDDFSYPAKPIRRHHKGLPNFTVVRGGEHVFLPGIGGLRWLSQLTGGISSKAEK